MLIAQRSETGGTPYQLRQMLMPLGGRRQFGRLGFDVALGLQVAGWIITGIGLGASVYESIWGGAEEAGMKPEDLAMSSGDIAAVASNLAKANPAGPTAAQWQNTLSSMLGPGGLTAPTPQLCPAGYYPDPASGACMPLQKAGILSDLSTTGWIAVGVGGLVLLRVLKVI